MRITIALTAGLVMVGSEARATTDELCSRLAQFERDVVTLGKGKPQWFEVAWGTDPDAIFSVACAHETQPAARHVCSWIPTNISMEFAGLLPKRVAKCYGLSSNRYDAYKFRERTTKFRSGLGNRLIMQTGIAPDRTPWFRLAVFPSSIKASESALPKRPAYTR